MADVPIAFLNPHVRRDAAFRGLFSERDYQDVAEYFRSQPHLTPTPLRALPSFAGALGVSGVDVKDETHRFGVNAFKIVGVRYAVHRLGPDAARRGLVSATAGNHGRAVARVAHENGLPCTLFLPELRTSDPLEQQTRTARAAAMRADGARVIDVAGTYEDAVRCAAEFGAESGAAIVSDTSWEGYTDVPRWIMAGYTHVLAEAASQWTAPPDVVFVQAGVGGLVCAAVSWLAWRFGAHRPFFIACEPLHAACLLESARAGRPAAVQSSLDTIMAGLRCAEPSEAAWPAIMAGVDAFVTVDDDRVLETLRGLAALGPGERVLAGPSGVCGLAALAAVMRDDALREVRAAGALGQSTRALAIITEGA